MPKAPDLPLAANLAYIGNYFLAGCTPPVYLFVDFIAEPTQDLLLLLLLPDLQDIVQGIADPRGRRGRSPGRHGRKPPSTKPPRNRKKGTGGGIPDISEMIATELRPIVNPGNALNYSAVRKAFKLLNIYERIAFTYALADGFSDIAFANFYGLATVRPGDCVDFSRFSRSNYGTQVVPGIFGPTPAANLPTLDFQQGISNSSVGFVAGSQNISFVYSAGIRSGAAASNIEVAARLRNVGTGETFTGGSSTIGPGGFGHVEVAGTTSTPGTYVWEFERVGATFEAFDQNCTCFQDLPPPPSWV